MYDANENCLKTTCTLHCEIIKSWQPATCTWESEWADMADSTSEILVKQNSG